jgi:hypothetical protein
MKTTVEALVAQTCGGDTEQYSPTRYPYTYACDFLRTNPQVIPSTVRERYEARYGQATSPWMSRSQAARIREMWAFFERRDDDEFARVLADAYLLMHGIEKPAKEPTDA